jgi:hypothetical protein
MRINRTFQPQCPNADDRDRGKFARLAKTKDSIGAPYRRFLPPPSFAVPQCL